MVAWKIDEARVAEVGRKLAGFRQVSHCYRRNPTDQWPYNLYTMVHGRDEAACRGNRPPHGRNHRRRAITPFCSAAGS